MSASFLNVLRHVADPDADSHQRYALTQLLPFCMSRDVDPRLRGTAVALVDLAGFEHSWIAEFFELVNSAEGIRQIHSLVPALVQYLENSAQYRSLVQGNQSQICRLTEGGIPSQFSHTDLFNIGDQLIREIVAQVRRPAAEVAGDLADALVHVLRTKIDVAQAKA